MANHCGPRSLRGGGGGGVLGVVGDSAGMLDEGSQGIRLNNRPKIGFSSGCDKGDSLGQSASVAITMRTMLTDTLLERLVALNAERAAEKAKGKIRWLRSEFQAKGAVPEKKTGAGNTGRGRTRRNRNRCGGGARHPFGVAERTAGAGAAGGAGIGRCARAID